MVAGLCRRQFRYLAIAVLWPVMSFMPVHHPGAAPHPFYVSVTEIAYNEAEKILEISCKVFTDDLEKALVKASAQPVDLYHPKDKPLLERQLAEYLRRHLVIRADNVPLRQEYVGYEIEEQSTYSYLQAPLPAGPPGIISVSNHVFFELFDKQMSIMHVTVRGKRKSIKLDHPKTEAEFDFR